MGKQTSRQAARRAALSVQAHRRRARAERDRQVEGLAVQVLTALGERDTAVAEAEQRAGEALLAMTAGEGLSLRDAVKWCGETLSVRDATRLRRLAVPKGAATQEQPPEQATGG